MAVKSAVQKSTIFEETNTLILVFLMYFIRTFENRLDTMKNQTDKRQTNKKTIARLVKCFLGLVLDLKIPHV